MLLATRVVTPGAPGPNRLDVDVSLLAHAQRDFRDVRLVDSDGNELAYLIVPPRDTQPKWIDGRVLPILPTKKTSGFEVDFGALRRVDRLRLDGIAPPFMKRITLEGSGDRTRWTLLSDATVFHLPDEDLRRTDIDFAAGDYRYLRATWDDRSSAPVMGIISARAREHDSAAPLPATTFDVQLQKRSGEPGKSRYRISLPGASLPITHIAIDVAGGNVFRSATITQPRLGNGQIIPEELGRTTLRRAERDGVIAADMEVAIRRPSSRELDLVIEDGSNPPLAITAVRARLESQPWIYFESADGTPLTARYGDMQAKPPQYDLEASRPYVGSRKVTTAQWSGGPGVADKIEALKPAAPQVVLGAPLERAQFRVSRKLPDAPPGLTVLVLDADVLARRNQLADVRIADAEGRQVPYIVEQRAEPLTLKLPLPQRQGTGRESIHRFDLPYADWPTGTRLVLTTDARVFDREVTVRRAADSHRNRRSGPMDRATWRSVDPDLLAPPLSFDMESNRSRSIEVVVDEGDNAPLALSSAQLIVPSVALRFHHPGTPLSLLYGNRRASTPRYDLELRAPQLFSAQAHELSLAPVAPRPDAEDDRQGRKLFWIGIAVAAIVLIALLAKLLSAETSRAPSDTTSH